MMLSYCSDWVRKKGDIPIWGVFLPITLLFQGFSIVTNCVPKHAKERKGLVSKLQNMSSSHIKVKKATVHVFYMATPGHSSESVELYRSYSLVDIGPKWA